MTLGDSTPPCPTPLLLIWLLNHGEMCDDFSFVICLLFSANKIPDNKVHGANMGPTWGRQDPGGTHVGPMNLAIRDVTSALHCVSYGITFLAYKAIDFSLSLMPNQWLSA